MTYYSYKPVSTKKDSLLGVICGVVFSLLLFIGMAVAQSMGDYTKPASEIESTQIALPPPEIEEFEEEIVEEEPEEEVVEEIEEKAPERLSLDQMDLALNPGMGGDLSGDVSLPSFEANQQSLGTDELFNFADLDSVPRLLDRTPFNFPAKLKKRKAHGRIMLYLEIDENGNVTLVEIQNSDLPKFNEFIVKEIKRRKFSQPTVKGKAVKARATMPIPIRIG